MWLSHMQLFGVLPELTNQRHAALSALAQTTLASSAEPSQLQSCVLVLSACPALQTPACFSQAATTTRVSANFALHELVWPCQRSQALHL